MVPVVRMRWGLQRARAECWSPRAPRDPTAEPLCPRTKIIKLIIMIKPKAHSSVSRVPQGRVPSTSRRATPTGPPSGAWCATSSACPPRARVLATRPSPSCSTPVRAHAAIPEYPTALRVPRSRCAICAQFGDHARKATYLCIWAMCFAFLWKEEALKSIISLDSCSKWPWGVGRSSGVGPTQM